MPGTRATLLPPGIGASRFIPISMASNQGVILTHDVSVTSASMLTDTKSTIVLNRTSQQQPQAKFLNAAVTSDGRSSPCGSSPGVLYSYKVN